MAKVYAPNKQYTGVTAGVAFVNGVGECGDPWRLDWFRRKGYTVEAEDQEPAEEPQAKEPPAEPKAEQPPEEKPRGQGNRQKNKQKDE